MPRIPLGSFPASRAVRSVPLVQFDSVHDLVNAGGGAFPLAPGAQLTSQVFDCFTSMYRGRGPSSTLIAYSQNWTRGIGEIGVGIPVGTVYRAAAVWIDATCQAVRSVSVRFDFINSWSIIGVPRVASSYLWLPVRGSAGGLSPVPLAHLIQGIRVPSPWFRWVLTNEDLAVDLLESEITLHFWFRSQ